MNYILKIVCYIMLSNMVKNMTLSKKDVPQLLTINDVAKKLKVHPNTLRSWDGSGILPAVKIGDKKIRRYKHEDIVKFINSSKKKTFTTVDFFAGIGGVRAGFEEAGFKTLFSNDYEQRCKDTYDLNFDDALLTVKDIREIDEKELPDFDFLLGGFPCQAFSVAGYRQGFQDEKGRGNLFFDLARIIEHKKPIGFLLENVKNLQGHDKGNTFKVIEQTLNELGYHIKYKILNSSEYGNVPQNRERIFIVGFRKDTELIEYFEFPEKQELTVSIVDILESPESLDEKYYYDDKPLFEKLKDYDFEENRVYQWRRKYVRENKSGVCPTLTANMGMGGHNVPIVKDSRGVRKLTPRECARIQGFPDSYKLPSIADSHLYKQFGNSVSVPVIKRIAQNIMKALK